MPKAEKKIEIKEEIKEEKETLEDVRDQAKEFFKKSNKDVREMMAYLKASSKETNREVREMSQYLKDWIKVADNKLKNIDSKLTVYEKKMVELTKLNDSIDETLGNVLLAIRQNEYLQAWYPPQQGHEEMKVVGRHPCQAKTEI